MDLQCDHLGSSPLTPLPAGNIRSTAPSHSFSAGSFSPARCSVRVLPRRRGAKVLVAFGRRRDPSRTIFALGSRSKCRASCLRSQSVSCALPLWTLTLLFDHLVSAGEQRGWHSEAERLSCLQVDYELELRRLNNGKVCRLSAVEDGASIDSDLTEHILDIGSVAHQQA